MESLAAWFEIAKSQSRARNRRDPVDRLIMLEPRPVEHDEPIGPTATSVEKPESEFASILGTAQFCQTG